MSQGRSAPSATSSVVLALLLLLLPSCGRDSDGAAEFHPTTTSRAAEELRPSSHVRMAERLARIAQEVDNPYFGTNNLKVIDEATDTLAKLPEGAVLRRWRASYILGWQLMLEGRNEESIEHLLAARELAPQIKDHLERECARNPRLAQTSAFVPGDETEFELGLAYLRLAEAQNCVARRSCESCMLPLRAGGVHVEKEPARRAMDAFLGVLRNHPSDLTTRWLLNVSAMLAEEFPDGVPERFRLPAGALESGVEFPRFREIAGDAGLANPDHAGGAVADDFDDDGDLDLVTSSIHVLQPIHFMRNEEGVFVDRTAEAGLSDILGGLNLIHGDYDGDGDLDLLVLRGAWWGPRGRHPNSLLRNEGDGTFVDVTYDAGLADPAWPTQTAAFADYDNDGDLDLYVGNESMKPFACPSQLFRNNGGGTFTDVARQARVENLRFAKGVTFGDYDGDGFPDLYVSNLADANRLYRNNGDGTFTDLAPELGVGRPVAGFATWFFDYDNDGALDIFAASYWNQTAHSVAGFFGRQTAAEPTSLYRGDGRGRFIEVTADVGLDHVTMPMGANIGDLDQDGYLDIYLGTGYPCFEGLVPNVMYWNRRGARFDDVTGAGGFGHLQKGHGVVFADLDSDGDQDVFEQMGGVFQSDGFGDVLFENPGFGRHWIKVSLVGSRSNRRGVGARIRAQVVEGGNRRSVYQWVGGSGSFGSNPLRVEIGLGDASMIEVLEVYWPTSDTTQTFQDVAPDRWLEIHEDEAALRVRELPPTRALAPPAGPADG